MQNIIKIIFTILLLAIFPKFSFTQKMEVYFGETGRWDVGRDIIEMYDKGYIISGGFEGSGELNYGWNIKTDINLELLYDKIFEHSLCSVSFYAAVSDNNGNVFVAGVAFIDDEWPIIVKLDSCGNKVWCKILEFSYEGFDYGWANDIIINENNEIIILSTLIDLPNLSGTINLISLTYEGELNWKKSYANKDDHPWIKTPLGNSIIEKNSNYYISGSCYWPYPNDTTHWFLRPLFVGIDSLFNEKWILPFAALDSVFGEAYNTIAINDSIFMGVGIRRLVNNVDYGLLMFYDLNGEDIGYNEITNDQIGNEINSNEIRDITKVNDSLFITGSFFGSDFSVNPVGELIIDTAGNIYNLESRPNSFSSPKIIKTYDSNYVIVTDLIEINPAKTDIYVYKIDENLNDVPFDPTPHNYDTLCPGGIQSGTIDLTDCFVWTYIHDSPSPEEYASLKKIPVKAYPNPVTSNKITFEYENTEYHQNIELRCFNIYGEEIHKEKIYRYQGKSVVNVSNWQKGMYFAVVYSAGKAVGKCKFVLLR